MNQLTLIFVGQNGEYYGRDSSVLANEETQQFLAIHQFFNTSNFHWLGKLTSTIFSEVVSYPYISFEGDICASVMKTSSALQGIDLITKFTDGAILTTTTVNLQITDYPDQNLFRFPHPDLELSDLLTYHLEYIAELEVEHGTTETPFSDLHSVAVMIDEYLQRQAENPEHGINQFINAMGIIDFSALTSDSEYYDDDEDEDDDGDEDIAAESPLVAAIQAEDIAQVRNLLASGADVDQMDRNCWYFPLGMAIEKENREITEILLEANADPIAAGNGYTSLGLAVKKGNVEIAQLLIYAGVDVNDYVGEDQETALMIAAWEGQLEMVQFLVEQGANVCAWGQGNTPIMSAARNGHSEIYNYLYPLLDDEYTCNYVVKYGERELQAAIKRKAREQNKAVEKFIDAAMYGNLERVQAAIEQGIEINALGSNDCTALMYAANYGHIQVVQALLEAGADPDILSDGDNGLGEGQTALMFIISSFFGIANRLEIVKLLIEAGADVNLKGKGGKTALMLAVEIGKGQAPVVKALVEAGADLDARDDAGNTALMLARPDGLMRKLLKKLGASEAGLADVDLIEAADAGKVEKVKNLIATGARVNTTVGEGNFTSALCCAAHRGHKEVVCLLLEAGADVNLGATTGFTPLAAAACEGYADITQLLIEAGAKVNLRCHDGDGYTALEYAQLGIAKGNYPDRQAGYQAIIDMLVDTGTAEC